MVKLPLLDKLSKSERTPNPLSLGSLTFKGRSREGSWTRRSRVLSLSSPFRVRSLESRAWAALHSWKHKKWKLVRRKKQRARTPSSSKTQGLSFAVSKAYLFPGNQGSRARRVKAITHREPGMLHKIVDFRSQHVHYLSWAGANPKRGSLNDPYLEQGRDDSLIADKAASLNQDLIVSGHVPEETSQSRQRSSQITRTRPATGLRRSQPVRRLRPIPSTDDVRYGHLWKDHPPAPDDRPHFYVISAAQPRSRIARTVRAKRSFLTRKCPL
jgi:hypothetical protein